MTDEQKDAPVEASTDEAPAPEVDPSQVATPAQLDPMLVDPQKVAAERARGTTSDAATRAEGTAHIDEVPADSNVGAKPSDAGPEAYPFPQGGDVEVATVDPGSGENEFLAPLNVEDAVILGEHELVPARLVGRRAFIVEAPRELTPVGQEDTVWLIVKTRDEVNATLNIPLSAVTRVERGNISSPLVRG